MDFVKTVSSLIVVAMLMKEACAIDCYVCTDDHTGCGETVSPAHLVLSGRVASGCNSCRKTFAALGTIWSSVTRSCSPLHGESCSNILGYGDCSCTTTLCNGVTSTSASGLSLVLAAYALKYILM